MVISEVCLHDHPEGCVLRVKAQPRSSRPGIDVEQGGELKVRVGAAPVDDAANGELVELLAREFSLARRGVRILRGDTSRHKVILLVGITAAAVRGLLAAR